MAIPTLPTLRIYRKSVYKRLRVRMGGKASHKNDDKPNDKEASTDNKENENNGRRADGTFLPNSETAKEAGHKGGLHAHGEKTDDELNEHGRREDGTFKPGSEAAKIAGHKGGLAAAAATVEK